MRFRQHPTPGLLLFFSLLGFACVSETAWGQVSQATWRRTQRPSAVRTTGIQQVTHESDVACCSPVPIPLPVCAAPLEFAAPPACVAPPVCAAPVPVPLCCAPIECVPLESAPVEPPSCYAPLDCAPLCSAPLDCAPLVCPPPDCTAPQVFDIPICPNCCGETCGEACVCDKRRAGGLTYGGWMQWGYTSHTNGLFNTHPHRFNMHQAWLYAEKVADGTAGADWGFRTDFMYGVDAADTQAFGNNPGSWDFQNGWDHGSYGWAMPQLYGEVAVGDVSLIVGHFYTLLGYEVVPAPDNFFYSHSLTMYNSEAFTHTGALATYKASDSVTGYAGYTFGWDTGFDQLGGGSNFLGGASVGVSDAATLTYITTVGNMGDGNRGGRGDGYTHSLVFDVALNDKLNYVIQSDLVSLSTGGFNNHNDEIGINQFVTYSVNDKLGIGARLEWWKSDSGFNYPDAGGNGVAVGGGSHSYHALTLGANIHPANNVVVRPEWRYDWSPASGYTQGTFGIDAIVTF